MAPARDPIRGNALMQLYAGTSGFSYRAWAGVFYPERIQAKAMLGYYATRLPTVEINNTFYRLPQLDVVRAWRNQVGPQFRFAVKAPQRITHRKRLQDCATELEQFFGILEVLEGTVGAILFQLPPFARADVAVLERFVGLLPQGTRAAFEFRHASWRTQEVRDVLAARNLALVLSETDEASPEPQWTANWAYLRLRKSAYSEEALARWRAELDRPALEQAYVYFKHEDEGIGPKLAETFLAMSTAAARSST